MAMKGRIGDAEVELDNAAELAVFEKILAELRQQNRNAGGSGGSGGITNLASPAGKLGKTLNGLNVTAAVLGRTLGVVTSGFKGIISLGSSAVNLSTGFIQAQPKVTDFSKALSNLPGILGDLGSAIHSVVDMLHKNYTTFQQLTTSGIAFGDRLEEMTGYGARFGIALSDVAGNLASNSEAFARLGTGTRGASLAIDTATIAFQQNKDMLLAFGMSFEEQNENFMKFFAQNSLALQRGTITQRQIIDMSDDYAKGLRRLSELTGIQSDQLQEGVDKANMNRAFDNFISNMDGETQNRMRAILNTVQAGFGDAGREAAMAAIMGVAPVTEASQQMLSLNRDFGAMLRGLNGSALNFTGSLESFNTMMYGQMNQFANANRGFADANSKYFAVLDMYGDPFGAAGGNLVGGINMFSGSIQDIESRLGRKSPLMGVFAQLESTIQEVRGAFTDLLINLLYDPRFQIAMTQFTDGVRNAGPAIAAFLGDFATAEGRQRNLDKIFDALATGFHELMLRINDTWLGYIISNDAMEAREKTKLETQVAEGTLDRAGLQAIVDDDTRFSPTRDAAESVLRDMRNAETAAGEANRLSIMDQFNTELRTMRARITDEHGGSLFDTNRLLNKADILNTVGSTDAEIQAASDNIFSSRADLEAFIDRFNLLGQYRASGIVGSTLGSGPGEVSAMGEALGYRHFGTYGMTGQFREPRGGFSYLRPDEKVLTGPEAKGLQDFLTGGSNSGMDKMANKIVDNAREGNVKLHEGLNTLISKIDRQNTLTRQLIGAVEHYS